MIPDFKNMPLERKNMIRLFATHALADIEATPSLILDIFKTVGIYDAPALQKVTGYNAFYEKLYMVKRQLDAILANPDGPTQVKNFLSAIIALKTEEPETHEKKNILKDMIAECQVNNSLWANDAALTLKYTDGVEMIDEWVDFFLSYTNRDQPDINNSYAPELEKSFKRVEWDESYDQMNFLAKLIIKYLKSFNSLNAFFDQQSMVNGDNLQDQVFKYCKKTFAFAQLVEPIALAYQPGQTNWCYDEYKHFMDNNSNVVRKKFFIKTHTMPQNIHPTYKEWYKDIADHLHYVISQPLKKTALQIKCGEIAKTIVETREQVITNYIASI
jgi:hypothetical protein